MENNKNGVFKINSDMINLIGCSKENFFKILDLMHYKPQKSNNDNGEYFMYKPKFIKSKKNKKKDSNQKDSKNNPFDKLSELRFT